MRIIAGSRKGARIFAPKGLDTRPTADRVREAAFNLLGPGAADDAKVLDLFAGYRDCAAQPDAWHEYSAALPEYALLPDSFMIAPGFDERSEAGPRLARDPSRWRKDVGDMLASNARWQLVLSFNEWPEGTSVESAREWATPSGYGAYLDTLHELLP